MSSYIPTHTKLVDACGFATQLYSIFFNKYNELRNFNV
jgi:hypothetical protein